MFKFIHCADLHLDSPLRGLARRPDVPADEIRLATRKALQNLVQLCIDEAVDFVVIAGDVYDGDWEDYTTGLYFNRSMAQLRDSHIRVYLIRGNHDAASQITRRLTLPDNVVSFPEDRPQTVILDDVFVAIHGQGFAQRAVTTNLALDYPPALSGYFNIGLLHTCAEGQEGHESYAPCRVDELIRKGYQYWALGHIHKRMILHENPYIVFSGNIQGRHIRETGEKGCSLVTVDGEHVRIEHRNLDVLRWYVCSVDLSGAVSDVDVTVAVSKQMERLLGENAGYPLVLRVELTGKTALHGHLLEDMDRYINEVRNAATVTGGDRIWLEQVKFYTEPMEDLGSFAEHADVIPALLRSIAAATQDAEFLQQFAQKMKGIQSNLRAYFQRPDAVHVDSVTDLDPFLSDAQEILLTLVSKKGPQR